MLRFTLSTFHEILNLVEDAQRRESCEYFPLELRLHAIDAIQFLKVVVVRIPLDLPPPAPIFPSGRTESEKMQALAVAY